MIDPQELQEIVAQISKEESLFRRSFSQRATLEEAKKAYRRLAQLCHPDAGGTHDAMARLNAARDAARTALG